MNNKGFGLQEFLVFIGIFMFCLVAAAIYGRAKFSSDDDSVTTNVNNTTSYIEPSLDELTPVDIENTSNNYTGYEELENKLLASSKHYDFNKEKNIVISFKEIKDSNLIDNLLDPNDDTMCDGYVTYDSEKEEYKPYIICGNNYKTSGFEEELLKK